MQDLIESVCPQLDEILKSVLKTVHKAASALGESALMVMSSSELRGATQVSTRCHCPCPPENAPLFL